MNPEERMPQRKILSAVIGIDAVFAAMLAFIPATLLAQWYGASAGVLFTLSALAIVPLAKYIGDATEELSIYAGPAFGGLLNATFGNATEFIIGAFALNAGLIEVVKASITGSILGNLLLVLGTAMLWGGFYRKSQTFNATAAKAAGSTLIVAVVALVMPALFLHTSGSHSAFTVEELSVAVSVLLMLAYAASLLFSLRTHKHLYNVSEEKVIAKWGKARSIVILLVSTVAVAFMSEILVGAITPMVATLGWTELFIGVIFIAIIGNAAEHASAVAAAIRGKMELALQISIGSATQVAMFVAPALVFMSLLFAKQMNLVFSVFELATLIFAVFIVDAVIEDGESNWFEGVQLLVAYIIIAAAFFLYT